jgi:hypothetical protein
MKDSQYNQVPSVWGHLNVCSNFVCYSFLRRKISLFSPTSTTS